MLKRYAALMLLVALTVTMTNAYGFAQQYDLGGATVSFVGWEDVLGWFYEGAPYEGRLEEAGQIFNCKIQIVPTTWAECEQFMMTRLISGDSAYDVWNITNHQFWPMLSKNAFLALEGILTDDYYNSLPGERRVTMDVLSFRGHKYAFGCASHGLWQFRMVMWNKDLAAALGTPNLYDLVESGEWTWDVYAELSKQATMDTDGDGKIDQWGMHGAGTSGWWYTNGAIEVREVDGKLVFALDSPEAIEVINKVLEWRTSGVAGGDVQGWAAGDALFMMQELWQLNNVKAGLEFEYGILPPPKGPRAERYVYPSAQVPVLTLPANSANPEALVALVDFLFPADEWWTKVESMIQMLAPDRESAKILMNSAEDWDGSVESFSGILGPSWDWSYPVSRAVGEAVTGQKPASVALSEVAPVAQAKLDEVFNQ